MRILVLTNYFPPARQGGGYGELCEEVADGLAQRGHAVQVMTSDKAVASPDTHPYPVQRVLAIDPDWESRLPTSLRFFWGRRPREQAALRAFQQALHSFQPELIFIWHAVGLPRALLQAAENNPAVPAVYYLADYQPEIDDEYLVYWRKTASSAKEEWLKRALRGLAKRQLRAEGKPLPLRYEHVFCVSDFVRKRLVSQGLIPNSAGVIHNGVDLDVFRYHPQAGAFRAGEAVRCLVAGRIIAHKGVHTVVNAFAALKQQGCGEQFHLTILGDGPQEYVAELKNTIAQQGLEAMVQFLPPVERQQMPDVLTRYQVFILSSEYDEPLARSMQEAMASGVLVVGTLTGGSGELLVHDQTGLAYPASDAQELADQLRRVISPDFPAQAIIRQARAEIEAHFDIRLTVARVESALSSIIETTKAQAHEVYA